MDAIASGQAPAPSGTIIPSFENFHPQRGDLVTNVLWFLSLALSLSAAFLAILVKQWGEGFVNDGHFSPFHVQVRIRQARYNEIQSWKTREFVRSLPILMHLALGLFLVGLMSFLWGLKLPKLTFLILAVVGVTFGCYGFATVTPLFFPFCPYNTPLSSRTFWGGLYSFIARRMTTNAGGKANELPVQRREQDILNNTSPDHLTAEAILWLVSHSENNLLVDEAIQTTASVVAGPEFWDSLAKERFVTIVARRFTAFCKTTRSSGEFPLKTTYYSRALARVAQYSTIQLVQATDASSFMDVSTKSKDIRVTSELFSTVEQGFHHLTECGHPEAKAAGFCAESAWYTSAGRPNYSNNKRGPLLTKIIDFLGTKPDISDELLVSLVQAIAVEVSHIREELNEELIKESFQSVIDLCDLTLPNKTEKLLDGPARGAMSATLAVISALLNHCQTTTRHDAEMIFRRRDDRFHLYGPFQESQNAYIQQFRYTAVARDLESTHWRPWFAQWVAQICTRYPEYLEANSSVLLLFGLSGILRSFRVDSAQAAKLAELFGDQLESVNIVNTEPIRLPFILSSTCDLREHIGDDIYEAILAPPKTLDYVNVACIPPQAKANILRRLQTNGLWVKFVARHELFVAISRLSRETDDQLLQSQCIIMLNQHWFMRSATGQTIYSPPDWSSFIDFKFISIWVKGFHSRLVTDSNPSRDELQSSTISCFAKLAGTIIMQTATSKAPAQPHVNQPAAAGQPTSQGTAYTPSGVDVRDRIPPPEILRVLEKLLLHDKELFEVFAKDIACVASSGVNQPGTDLKFWRNAILCLPKQLVASSTSQAPTASTGHPAHVGSTPAVPAASASSQAPPITNTPQAPVAIMSAQAPVTSGSQAPAADSSPPIQVTSAGSQAPTTTVYLQSSTGADPQVPSSSAHVAAAFTQLPTAGSNTQTSSSTFINSNAQASTSSAPALTTLQPPPMTREEARGWLRTFADNNANSEQVLGELARNLRDELTRTD
ncbi:unnamed protein product, partial [Rhizoctonia solani]